LIQVGNDNVQGGCLESLMNIERALQHDDAYFQPLRNLTLPPQTELFLGLVHSDGVDATRNRIEAAARYVPDFGIATECGMARCRTPQLVRTLLHIHADASAEPKPQGHSATPGL
jgi:hypothetical protein